jgi:hypothetical protein
LRLFNGLTLLTSRRSLRLWSAGFVGARNKAGLFTA